MRTGGARGEMEPKVALEKRSSRGTFFSKVTNELFPYVFYIFILWRIINIYMAQTFCAVLNF